jgi:hypothetical protein
MGYQTTSKNTLIFYSGYGKLLFVGLNHVIKHNGVSQTMKNLLSDLSAAMKHADNVVGTAYNESKGKKYAKTPETLNYARSILAQHNLSVCFMPGRYKPKVIESKTRDGKIFKEQAGVASLDYYVVHISGEMMKGTASMPVNIWNVGLSSADKAMGAWTILTRKIVLGLLGVVEVDSAEKTLEYAQNAAAAEEDALSDAITAMNAASGIEERRAVYAKAKPKLSVKASASLLKIAQELNAKEENSVDTVAQAWVGIFAKEKAS